MAAKRQRKRNIPYLLLGIVILAGIALLAGIMWRGNVQAPAENTIGQAFIDPTGSIEVCGKRVFIDDRDTPNKNELYSEDIATGVVTKLSRPLQSPGQVYPPFKVTPDGQYVVYIASKATASTTFTVDLFVVPINGGVSTQLNPPLPERSQVGGDFIISPNGQYVAYIADDLGQVGGHRQFDLFTVPITGGDVKKRTHVPVGFDVRGIKFTPDSEHIVYTTHNTVSGQGGLYSAPSADGVSKRLVSPTERVRREQFTLSCDSQTVYFLKKPIGTPLHAYSIPVDGGTATQLASDQLPTLNCPSPPAPTCTTPPTCKQDGESCTTYMECCSDTCGMGACIPSQGTPPPAACTSECTAGATQCTTQGVRTCGNYDADSCTEWSAFTACPAGQACIGNACGTPANRCNQQPRAVCRTDPVAGATIINAYCAACTISPCPPPGTPPPKCYQCPEGQQYTYDYATRTASCA